VDISYEYEPTPTSWQLLWEDTRYQGGARPDELFYLDETTAFPDHPPRHVPG